MTVYTRIESPLGELLLVGEDSPTATGGTALTSLSMPDQRNAARIGTDWRAADEAFDETVRQLREYFEGRRTAFELELAAEGTPFQQRVWAAVDTVGYGSTVSYGELARRAGVARSDARAVGTAVGANPLLLVRACHRVIGADGSLRGYAAGIPRKEALLTLEGALQPQLG